MAAVPSWYARDTVTIKYPNKPDDVILAYAKRLDRILITHDDRFVDKKRFAPEDIPGIVIVPGGSGDVGLYLGEIGMLLLHIGQLRDLYSETVVELREDSTGTIWNHEVESGNIKPIAFCLRSEVGALVEVWHEDDGDMGVAPPEAFNDEFEDLT